MIVKSPALNPSSHRRKQPCLASHQPSAPSRLRRASHALLIFCLAFVVADGHGQSNNARTIPALPAFPVLPPRTNRVAAAAAANTNVLTVGPGRTVNTAATNAVRTNVAVTGVLPPPPAVTPSATPNSVNTVVSGANPAPAPNPSTLAVPQKPTLG